MIYEEVVVLSEPFDEALARVKDAFKAEGFGTLTEIDVQATLREKIDKEMDPYVILGTCNPNLASQALDALPQIGALLPCNVVVRQTDTGVAVEAMDPMLMASITEHAEIKPIADRARELIGNAMRQLAESG